MTKIFTMRDLGKNGRFGNQLFQFCAGKALARYYDAEFQIPADCELRKYFDIKEKPIEVQLPTLKSDQLPNKSGYDLTGYFQYQEIIDLYTKKDAIEWLPFNYKTSLLIEQSLKPIYYLAMHKRRGDYVKLDKFYATVSDTSYNNAINKYGYLGKNFIVYSDESKTQNHWWDDFIGMCYSSVLFRANSSFSFWAGVLGKDKKVYSPIVEDKVGWQDVEFVEGNWPRMTDCKNHGPWCKVTDLYLKEK